MEHTSECAGNFTIGCAQSALSCLPLAEVIAGARAETTRFERGDARDDRFAMELLGRALRLGDHAAWEAFINQYGDVVLAQVHQHPGHRAIGEDDTFWLNRTFQRFMGAVGPERLDQFANLPAVLGYLRMCGLTALLDELRRRKRQLTVSLDEASECVDPGFDLEERAIGNIAAQNLWRMVMAELTDESERFVTRLSLKYGYDPRQIYTRHPERFASVKDVYRIKRKAIERLRRNPAILQVLANRFC